MAEEALVRRAAQANIRSYYIAILGLAILVYATFFQPKQAAPTPPPNAQFEPTSVATPVDVSWRSTFIDVRKQVMNHTEGIGISLILIGMLASGAMHLAASGGLGLPGLRRKLSGQAAPVSLPYPTIRIFRHKESRKHNDAMFHQIHDTFAQAGWRVESSDTDLPQHENGIRIAGKAGYAREAAKWGLSRIGIDWIPDERRNPPETLEVIVGRYDAVETTVQESTDVARVRAVLEEKLQETEKLRGDLGAEIQRLKVERDGMEQAWLTCKKAFGIWRLSQFAQRVGENIAEHNAKANEESKLPDVRVTIRFVGYATADLEIVKRIESVLGQHTSWKIHRDGGNNPALMPSDEYKVIFCSGALGTFDEVGGAFQDGRLIDAAIGFRRNPNGFEQGHLVIEVLPTPS